MQVKIHHTPMRLALLCRTPKDKYTKFHLSTPLLMSTFEQPPFSDSLNGAAVNSLLHLLVQTWRCFHGLHCYEWNCSIIGTPCSALVDTSTHFFFQYTPPPQVPDFSKSSCCSPSSPTLEIFSFSTWGCVKVQIHTPHSRPNQSHASEGSLQILYFPRLPKRFLTQPRQNQPSSNGATLQQTKPCSPCVRVKHEWKDGSYQGWTTASQTLRKAQRGHPEAGPGTSCTAVPTSPEAGGPSFPR